MVCSSAWLGARIDRSWFLKLEQQVGGLYLDPLAAVEFGLG